MDFHVVEMTNYSVPFDFDGNRIAWVEFLSQHERNVCVYYIDNKFKWQYKIEKSFGHISHLKLLPKNRIFIVRQLNLCEIRDTDNDFKLLHKFTSPGDEVIAADFYFQTSKFLLNDVELDNIQINKQNPEYVKIPVDKNKKPNEEEIKNEEISIILLDIDGNINLYENCSVTNKLNLYKMKDINDDLKNKQFFSMGYPYYIKGSLNHIAISTDHGVIVIKKDQ